MVVIETVSIQKPCDTLNKIKVFEAKQRVGETIRGFVKRRRRLAYECNFTTKYMSKSCTEGCLEDDATHSDAP